MCKAETTFLGLGEDGVARFDEGAARFDAALVEVDDGALVEVDDDALDEVDGALVEVDDVEKPFSARDSRSRRRRADADSNLDDSCM